MLDTPSPPTISDPNPSRPVDLDYPTLGRLIAAEAQDLGAAAQEVNDELLYLLGGAEWDAAAADLDHEAEALRSPDELIANLNGIGVAAYRLARHVRTLVEFRTIYLAHRADHAASH